MISTEKIYKLLLSKSVDFFVGVPDSLLKDFCAYVTDHAPSSNHIIASNEGAAVAMAAGHYLATGELGVVYMQNSGLGNAVNPLLSLADEKVYQVPMLLMVGWRGEPGVKDEPQHVKQGEVTLDLLQAMQIPYVVINEDSNIAEEQFHEIISNAKTKGIPHAAVIRKNIFETYKLVNKIKNDFPLSREVAMQKVVDALDENDVVISTTGKLSRELFEYREQTHAGHSKDFLTVGSMGHSSAIALGIALSKPDRRVYCFDGDGAVIMQMGTLVNLGTIKLKNLNHVVFNNGAHESVGGQPTVALEIDIPAIAKACGYVATASASSVEEIELEMKHMQTIEGPALLEIKINTASRDNLGRPTTTTHENKKEFMQNLNK